MAASSTPIVVRVGFGRALRAGLRKLLSEGFHGCGSLCHAGLPRQRQITRARPPDAEHCVTDRRWIARVTAARADARLAAGPGRSCRRGCRRRAPMPQASSKGFQCTSKTSLASGAAAAISRSVARYRCSTSPNTPGELKYAAETLPAGWPFTPASSMSSRARSPAAAHRARAFPAGSSQSQPSAAWRYWRSRQTRSCVIDAPPPPRHRDGEPARVASRCPFGRITSSTVTVMTRPRK